MNLILIPALVLLAVGAVLMSIAGHRKRVRDICRVIAAIALIAVPIASRVYVGVVDGQIDAGGMCWAEDFRNRPVPDRVLTGARAVEACQFDGSDLRGATFGGTKITDTSFRRTDLSSVSFAGSEIRRVSLDGANLRFSNLARVALSDSSAREIDGRNLLADDAQFTRVDLAAADLTGASMSGAVFSQVDMSGAIVDGANLAGADLRGALGVTAQQLSHADVDRHTQFPPYLTVSADELTRWGTALQATRLWASHYRSENTNEFLSLYPEEMECFLGYSTPGQADVRRLYRSGVGAGTLVVLHEAVVRSSASRTTVAALLFLNFPTQATLEWRVLDWDFESGESPKLMGETTSLAFPHSLSRNPHPTIESCGEAIALGEAELEAAAAVARAVVSLRSRIPGQSGRTWVAVVANKSSRDTAVAAAHVREAQLLIDRERALGRWLVAYGPYETRAEAQVAATAARSLYYGSSESDGVGVWSLPGLCPSGEWVAQPGDGRMAEFRCSR